MFQSNQLLQFSLEAKAVNINDTFREARNRADNAMTAANSYKDTSDAVEAARKAAADANVIMDGQSTDLKQLRKDVNVRFLCFH